MSRPCPSPSHDSARHARIAADDDVRLLARAAWGVLLIGLGWRLGRYLLRFPIWVDEAMLVVNLPGATLASLTQRLENCQVAPLLFLWGEHAAFRFLGAGELTMRLLPFLAGIGGLLLFVRLSQALLPWRASLLAIGVMAVSSCPVTLCTNVKPYSLDLCVAVGLLLLAVHWLNDAARVGRLLALAVATPLAVLASYPAIFVAGGIGLCSFARAWRERWAVRAAFALYAANLAASFNLAIWIGNRQLASPFGAADTAATMAACWDAGFPPGNVWAGTVWLARSLAGDVVSYPLGTAPGAGLLTTILCLVGGMVWWREGRRLELGLLASPLALHLVAAALHKYPFGPSPRVTQHLAPPICLLAGLGLAMLLQRLPRSTASPSRSTLAVLAVLGLLGVGGFLRDVLKPFRDPASRWTREVMREIDHLLAPDDVVILPSIASGHVMFDWYWKSRGARRPQAGHDGDETIADGESTWIFAHGRDSEECERLVESALARCEPGWIREREEVFQRPAVPGRDPGERCVLVRLVQRGDRASTARSGEGAGTDDGASEEVGRRVGE